MKKYLLVAVIVLSSGQACAQPSPQWGRLESLRQKIVLPHNDNDELDYLASFPHTFYEYQIGFGGNHPKELELSEIYDQHLETLAQLAKKYPAEIDRLEISIAVGGHWDADAVGDLQDQMTKLAASDTSTFAKQLLQKSRAERASVIQFMADVENHAIFTSMAKSSLIFAA